LLDASVRFVQERVLDDGPDLRPTYRANGKPVPEERASSLPGYPGATEVRFGNRAAEQFQLDIFGEVMTLMAVAATRDRLSSDGWRAAEVAADAVQSRWTEPDSGVWELDAECYTHSRLACIAGLRNLASAAGPGPRANTWLALADAIESEISRSSVHPDGRWQRSPRDDRIDASLLVGSVRGATTSDDPRARATLEAVRRDLLVDGYVFRYAADYQPLGEAEGAFLLCGFWLALACQRGGEQGLALRLFERNRAACGPAGLFAEEYDIDQRQLRGNFPQAFVHALLLESAMTLTANESVTV
jgi:GH15 family glucan-1,4-alpha-glucosidase